MIIYVYFDFLFVSYYERKIFYVFVESFDIDLFFINNK